MPPTRTPQSLARRIASVSAATAASLLGARPISAEPPPIVTIEVRPSTDASESETRRCLGFIVEEEGFILTTYRNVVSPETGRLLTTIEIERRSAPGERHPARLIGVEPTLDLAILQIEGVEGPLPAADLKANAGFSVGQEIYAPGGLDGDSVVLGRLTGLNSKECYQETLTAAMYRAEMELPDSLAGAPIYAKNGEIVAIHTAYSPPEQEGHLDDEDEMHMLPIFLALNIYDSIKEKRSLASPWTGFSVRALTPHEATSFPTTRGHRGGIAIEAVIPKSPAERLGIREGDVLVQLGHNPIESVPDFQKWLYLYGVGHEVDLVLLRGEALLTAKYVIEERPPWAKPR